MHFYDLQFGTCDVCRKPATHEIQGTGNVRYRYSCPRHVASQITQLTKAHNAAEVPR